MRDLTKKEKHELCVAAWTSSDAITRKDLEIGQHVKLIDGRVAVILDFHSSVVAVEIYTSGWRTKPKTFRIINQTDIDYIIPEENVDGEIDGVGTPRNTFVNAGSKLTAKQRKDLAAREWLGSAVTSDVEFYVGDKVRLHTQDCGEVLEMTENWVALDIYRAGSPNEKAYTVVPNAEIAEVIDEFDFQEFLNRDSCFAACNWLEG